MSTPAVAVADVWVGYRPGHRRRLPWRGEVRWALEDVTFDVAQGEMLGVIGTNGSGKTTLLQTLAGVIRPDRGSVSVEGRVASLVELSAGFHRDLSGAENLRLGGVLLGLGRRTIDERFDEVVAFAGLPEDALEAPLATYSSGMGLRLGFSLMVHTDPSVLLVDEVLAVGDEAFQQRCLDRIRALLDAGGAGVLVSHDLDLVQKECDRVLVLRDGRVVADTTAREAVDRYRSTLAGESG